MVAWPECTATTRNIRSARDDREAQGHREYRERREALSLRHDRLSHRLLYQDHLEDQVLQEYPLALSLWVPFPLCHPGHLWVLCDRAALEVL